MMEQNDLATVVEKLRMERYPEVPRDLVLRILALEEEHLAMPDKALRPISDAILANMEEAAKE